MISETARKLRGLVPTYEGVGGLTCEMCPVNDERDEMNPEDIPEPYLDGDSWCCLLGDDLQTGIAAFGDTPEEAREAFVKAYDDED